MRSTRATAAVERLKARSGNDQYMMVRTGDELFYLAQNTDDAPKRLSDPLPLDEFVLFVNGFGPQTPRRVTKMDTAFEKQLARKEN